MATIRPVTQPARWLIALSGAIEYEGITHVGELTGVNPDYTAIYAEGEAEFAGAVADSGEAVPALPDAGWLEVGEVYAYQDTVLVVRIRHDRAAVAHHNPLETHLYWTRNSTRDWVAWEEVYVGIGDSPGTRRLYDGVWYEAMQTHTTQPDWTPPATLGVLWAEVVEEPVGPAAWKQPTGAQDSYALDAQATHVGATWQSRRNNNVWEPGTNNSGWLRIEPYPSAWYYLGSEGYPLDWRVYHKDKTWRCTSNNNFYEPGVWGWAVV